MIIELPELTATWNGIPFMMKNVVFRPTWSDEQPASLGTFTNRDHKTEFEITDLEELLKLVDAVKENFPPSPIVAFAKCPAVFACEKLERERGPGWFNVSAAERNIARIKRWRHRNLEVAFIDANKWLWFPEPAWPLLEQAIAEAKIPICEDCGFNV